MTLPSKSYICMLEQFISFQHLGWKHQLESPSLLNWHILYSPIWAPHPFWRELKLANPLMSRDLYELWTDPSSLSCADLRQGNENNEQWGWRQSLALVQAGPHCTMGHRTGRQGTRGPHYQVCSPYRGTREQGDRAEADGWGSSRAPYTREDCGQDGHRLEVLAAW